MISWLSEWLRDIIAVVLLAVIIELILPSHVMQRYVRLVMSLFILLTILSPVLQLLQTDFHSKLDSGIASWNASIVKSSSGPSLSDIQEQGLRLQDKRSQEAARLTERTLEESMTSELKKRLSDKVEAVEVDLIWQKHAGGGLVPSVRNVLVSLQREDAASEQLEAEYDDPTEAAEESSDLAIEVQPVDVERIDIQVEPVVVMQRQGALQPPAHSQPEGWIQADQREASMIKRLISQGWGIEERLITVRQRAASHTN